ncbi:MAG: hypothetical protein JNM56_12280 [Planctomycetia bacterium]|nr:hypothetical protein [Planctomycetia bacterium]
MTTAAPSVRPSARDAFRVEFESNAFQCERRLIEQAFARNHAGKCLTTILDDAHLMDLAKLRQLRLLFEDFPKNHNLIRIGRPSLLAALDLGVNHDIKSRVTYSDITKRLHADDLRDFILRELDRVGLGPHTFTRPALDLIVRSADGVLRQARNLCVGCLIEAVRRVTKTIDIDHVNRVLLQPHWHQKVISTRPSRRKSNRPPRRPSPEAPRPPPQDPPLPPLHTARDDPPNPGKVTAHAVIPPGKVRGFAQLRFRIDGWELLSAILGNRMPDSVLKVMMESRNPEPSPEFQIDLGEPTRRGLLAPKIAELRAQKVSWPEIAQITGIAIGNAYNVWKRHVSAQGGDHPAT